MSDKLITLCPQAPSNDPSSVPVKASSETIGLSFPLAVVITLLYGFAIKAEPGMISQVVPPSILNLILPPS